MISKNVKLRFITSIVLLLLLYLALINKLVFVFLLLLISIFSFIEFSQLIKKIFYNNVVKLLSNILFIIYLSLICLYFFTLSNYFFLKIILFSLLLTCVASDIGGYIFGKILKGPKIFSISPKKTVSGAIGSIICSMGLFTSLIFFLTNNLNLYFLLIGFFTSIACQAGDLFFSFLKRKAKVKDTGKFLPGHGGFLDRIDGILLGLPVGFLTTIFFLN